MTMTQSGRVTNESRVETAMMPDSSSSSSVTYSPKNVAMVAVGIPGEAKDPADRFQSARDLAQAIPTAQAFEVVHARKMSLAEEHNWNLSAPDLFTQTVRAWLADQALPAALKPLEP